MPTTSRSSPTTTSAVNEKRRPPLTTLATRLISTTRSWRSRPAELTERSIDMDMGRCEGSGSGRPGTLDGYARLADRVGEGAHVAVVAVAAAVEHGLGDPGRLGALGQQRTGPQRPLGFPQRAQLGLEPVDRRDRVPGHVVDQLRREPAIGAEHRNPRTGRRAGHLRAHPATALEPAVLPGQDAHARLPTLRCTYSPS